MLENRVIPSLLLRNESLVKTIQFGKFTYIGDPCNTVRIFNELEVDELMFLDISATTDNREPNFKLLSDIANECFMPLCYGGGISNFEIAKKIFEIGFEKIVLNSHIFAKPTLIAEITNVYGNQAVVASLDVKKNIFGKYSVFSKSGTKNCHLDPVEWAKELEERGAGEILLTAIDREGTWEGFDLKLISSVSKAVSIPVIANGGAGNIQHLVEAIHEAKASAVSVGSMVTFQKKGMGVLVNFPDKEHLKDVQSIIV